MKIEFKISLVLLLCSCFFYNNVVAQVPSGGTNIIQPIVGNVYFYNGEKLAESRTVQVTGQSFSQAIEVKITGQPVNSWGTQLQFNEIGDIALDDVILVTFWARVTQSIQETGEGFVNVIIENNSSYDKQISHSVSLGNQWTQYYIPFLVTESLNASQIGSALHFGVGNQTVEIAALEIINYKNAKTLDEMPKTAITYVGREEDDPWRIEAENRIEQYRKGDIEIKIIDNIGQPIEGANVTVTMLEHQFGFGSAIKAQEFLDSQQFRDTALALFNEYTIENALKWQSYQWPSVKVRARETVDLMKAHGKRIRGHVLVWPSFRYNPTYLQDYKNNPAELRLEIDNHISELVTEFKGDLVDWDVMNEPYTNYEFMDILGYDEMASWFNQTRAIDNQANLYINDYSILSAGGLDINHQDAYFNTIKKIDTDGGNIEGIGMQGHFSSQLTPITKVYSILDKFSTLNKPIKITEFDINLTDEEVQHDYTRDFMTIVFSHPSVDAFIVWGFWAGAHWKPEAAMYNLDWTPRKNLTAYKDLVFSKWWTNTLTETTNIAGVVETRGFLGKYEIRSEFDNEIVIDTVLVDDNSSVNEVILKHSLVIVNASTDNIHTENLYPNPTTGIVHFNKPASYKLFTTEGILLEADKRKSIDLKKNKSGTYFIEIDNIRYKIIKHD